MTKDVLSKVLDRLGLVYLLYHLTRSPHNTFEEWWCAIVQDSLTNIIIKHRAVLMIYKLYKAASWDRGLQVDLMGCCLHLALLGGDLEDVPWSIIEEALEALSVRIVPTDALADSLDTYGDLRGLVGLSFLAKVDHTQTSTTHQKRQGGENGS